MALYKDVEGYRKLFDEEYKKTRELIYEGETHLDNLAEGFSEASRVIDRMPTADVVPKSEYDKAVNVIEKVKCLTAEIKADLPLHNKQIKTETAREIFKELDGALAYCMESHPYAIERYCEIKRKYIEQ